MKKDTTINDDHVSELYSINDAVEGFINDVAQWLIDKLPAPTAAQVDAYGDSNASIGDGVFNEYWDMLIEQLGSSYMDIYSEELKQRIKVEVLKNYDARLDELRDEAVKQNLTLSEYLAGVNHVSTLNTTEHDTKQSEYEQMLSGTRNLIKE